MGDKRKLDGGEKIGRRYESFGATHLVGVLLSGAWLGCDWRVDPGSENLPHLESFDQRWSDASIDDLGVLSFGEVSGCSNPMAEVSYTESAEAWGLEGASAGSDSAGSKSGVAVVHDFDDDGELDVVLGFDDEPPVLYRGTGVGFVREPLPIDDTELPVLGELTISLVDMDGDGWYGLMGAGPPAWRMINREGVLLENDPVHTVPGPSVIELIPLDIEADGDLDYFVVSDGSRSSTAEDRRDYLIRTEDDLIETPDSIEPLELPGASGMGFDGLRLDWDRDGDLDVYVVNDQGEDFGGNVLWENRDGVLVDVTDDCDCGIVHSAMGVDRADYDGDGDGDLYITAIQHNVLLQNQGDGRFVDVATATGADTLNNDLERMSWGAIFLDYDNDGWMDILASEGDQAYDGLKEHEPVVELASDMVRQIRTEEGPSFVSVGETLGLRVYGYWRATIAMDFNHDGVPDLLVTDATDRPLLFLSDGCTANGWIDVEAPLDSMVEICTSEACQTGWVSTDSSWGGARSPILHWGLGDESEIVRMGVRGPSGEARIWSAIIDGRRRIRVPDP